jgi:hypothetical protein
MKVDKISILVLMIELLVIVMIHASQPSAAQKNRAVSRKAAMGSAMEPVPGFFMKKGQ